MQLPKRLLLTLGIIAALRVVNPAVAAEPSITALAFTPDGKSVLVGSQAGLDLHSWPGLAKTRELDTELLHIHDIAFAPNGKSLAVVGGTPAAEGILEVYTWPVGKLRFRTTAHDDLIYAVAWRADSAVIATAGLDRIVRLHDSKTGKSTGSIEGHSRGVTAISWLPAGKTLVTAGIDQSLRVWNSETRRAVRTLDNHTKPVHDLAPRPGQDADTLPMIVSVSEDRTIRFWQPTIGRMVRFARIKGAEPLAAAWLPRGQLVIITCTDGHVRTINPDTTEIVGDIAAIKGWAYSLAVHPRERAAVVGGQHGQLRRVVIP